MKKQRQNSTKKIERANNLQLPGSIPLLPKGVTENDFNKFIMRVQLARIKQDIGTWRAGVTEAENPWFPWRVKMQQLFIDTVLNGHVAACMKRRSDLTMMKDFIICDENDKEDEEWTAAFRKKWFYELMQNILDAQYYGFSLINWTSMKDGIPEGIQIVRRWNVSPDRYTVQPFLYSVTGADFRSPELDPFCLYVPTPSQTGASPCGFGLLYKVAVYEIFCRNTLAFNGDFVERYSQPYRVGRTDKTAGAERDVLEQALKDMGNSNYAVLDNNDSIEFLETALGGTGYKGYESLEMRCEKKISKLLLGHSDAMDSTPGKLGGGQSGGESPVELAMNNIASEQNRSVMFTVNDELLPKLRQNGLGLPDNLKLKFLNDEEEAEIKSRQNAENTKVGSFVQTMNNAGYEIDEAWLSEQTGVPIKKKEILPPEPPAEDQPGDSVNLPKSIQNKLKKLYGGK